MTDLISEKINAVFRRELNHTFLIIEAQGTYKEDYQMRMLKENKIDRLLDVKGSGIEKASRYEYDVSGKVSLKSIYEKQKINAGEMKDFLHQLSEALEAVTEYLLDEDRLLLDPEYIFFGKGTYHFCYLPVGKNHIWSAFHRLMDSFVQWTDYQDTESVKTAFMLHKESMEDNYSLKGILEMLDKERDDKDIHPVSGQLKEEGSPYETAEHDWITNQEMGSRIMEETENLWTPVRRFLQKHKKPKWGDWDGIYIEEEEL